MPRHRPRRPGRSARLPDRSRRRRGSRRPRPLPRDAEGHPGRRIRLPGQETGLTLRRPMVRGLLLSSGLLTATAAAGAAQARPPAPSWQSLYVNAWAFGSNQRFDALVRLADTTEINGFVI